MASILNRHQTRAKTPKPVSSANMTVFIAPCYTEQLNWPLGLTLCPSRPNYRRKIPICNNAGGVKQSLSTRSHALKEERLFALGDGLRFPTWARSNRQGPELSPTQPSLQSLTAIMIAGSNSLRRGSGMPNHYVGDLLPTIAISGRSRVRTELFELAVVPALAPHPVQMHRQLARHRYFGNLSSAARIARWKNRLRHCRWLIRLLKVLPCSHRYLVYGLWC